MTCEQVDSFLSAYIDHELDLAASLEVERHLEVCTSCRAALELLEDLRAATRNAIPIFAAPRSLERRIRASVRREGGRRSWPVPPKWQWALTPLAAVLVGAIAWSIAVDRPGGGEGSLRRELVSNHVRSLLVDHLVDVASSDRHTVKPWFNGKVDFGAPVNDFEAEGFPLVGGRLDYVAGRTVAVLVYKRRRHTINVFIWPQAGDGTAAPRAFSDDGYQLVRWARSGLTFWAVSDVAREDLLTLARLVESRT